MVKNYVITAAQRGARINQEFLTNLDLYAQTIKAEVIVLPMSGKSVTEETLAEGLETYRTITSDTVLNRNVRISNFEVKPQQINPLTGVDRFAQGDRSVIFAGTKQHLKYVANGNTSMPKAIMTTGAVTHPNYRMSHRIGQIAYRDHEYGAVVVQLRNQGKFHFRHIKAQKNGRFYDINTQLHQGELLEVGDVPAMVIGDIHPYDTDPKHLRATFDQIAWYNPKAIFLHDAFNAHSISHHYEGHSIEKAKVAARQGLKLRDELEYTAKVIKGFCDAQEQHGGTVYVVKSNHDEHLYRYLDEGRFIDDPANARVACQLYLAALEGADPLEVGLRTYLPEANNLIFLQRDEDLKVRGYQLGNHGDLGANGGRGSMRSIEAANGKSITGHTHSASKIRDTYKVGTATHYRIGYNRGYSNWTQTNAVVYDNGQVQLLNTIAGRWR